MEGKCGVAEVEVGSREKVSLSFLALGTKKIVTSHCDRTEYILGSQTY